MPPSSVSSVSILFLIICLLLIFCPKIHHYGREGLLVLLLDYRLFCMAMSQRWVSAPPWPTEPDAVSRVFELFYDKNGPRKAFKKEWANMSPEERAPIRMQMEEVHDRMFDNFRAMPPQLMLIFRYIC